MSSVFLTFLSSELGEMQLDSSPCDVMAPGQCGLSPVPSDAYPEYKTPP